MIATNLINHSYYSLLNSALSLEDIVETAIKNNQGYASLVDINTMFGTHEFIELCKKNNLKPIIGLQISYHGHTLVLFATNYDGIKQLYKISSLVSKNVGYDLSKYISKCIVVALDDSNQELVQFCTKYYKNSDAKLNEFYYFNEPQKQLYKTIIAIRSSCLLNEVSFEEKPLLETNESLVNEIVEKINIIVEIKNTFNILKFPNAKEKIRENCLFGLKKYGFENNHEYKKRLEYELSVINNMGFNDYFLLISEYVKWCKMNDIFIGPGRGSAAGSLVSYLLNITMVDPIKNNLIFERFLNPDRKTMPDIDIDIEDINREKLLSHLYSEYGCERVCNIITFQRMKAKLAITDVGRVLGINVNIIKNITKLFGIQNEGDILTATKNNAQLKTFYDAYPELFDLAHMLLNFPRSHGIHAAGVIICNEDISNVIPVFYDGENVISQFEMEALEYHGLIKMDILSLANLTIIKEIINEVNNNNKTLNLSIETIEMDNTDVFKQLSNGDTIGIFQLESQGMTSVVKRVKPKTIEDISLVLALFRPGALGVLKDFYDNKDNPSGIKYINDDFKKILAPTYGVVVYQEQLMELIRITCGYTLAKADVYRRVISKKKVEMIAQLKVEFIKDAIKNGNTKEQAENIFNYVEAFAGYGFNHSHSISYAYIVYWMIYLKYYYPREFLKVLISNNVDRTKEYLHEFSAMNIKYSLPDIRYSTSRCEIIDEVVYLPLTMIAGVGNTVCENINKVTSFFKLEDPIKTIGLLMNAGVGPEMLSKLIYAGTLDKLFTNEFNASDAINNLTNIKLASRTMTKDGEFVIYPNIVKTEPISKENFTRIKTELLGFSSEDLLDNKYLKERENDSSLDSLSNSKIEMGNHKVFATISSFKSMQTKYGAEMGWIILRDDTSELRCTVWPGPWAQIKSKIVLGQQSKLLLQTNEKGTTIKGFAIV